MGGRVSIRTVTLFRPVGPKELSLIQASGYRAFPPRLSDQPVFYPVLTEEYAVKIERDWNASSSRTGYLGCVTRFAVRAACLHRYEVHDVGGSRCQEYWIPAEDLPEFNANIVGLIEVISEFSSGPGAAHQGGG